MKTGQVIVLAALLSTFVAAEVVRAEDASDRARVVKFLKDHIIGKTVSVKVTEKIAKGEIETEFARTTSFVNFFETHNGFGFDMVFSIMQTNYDLDKDGQRVQPGRKEDRVLVTRYEVSERKSSNKLIGFSSYVTNTFHEDQFGASSIRVKLEEDVLSIDESTVLYNDFFAGGGKFKPGAVDVHSDFRVIAGKLKRTSTSKVFDVNPDTLERTARVGKNEVLIDNEIDVLARQTEASMPKVNAEKTVVRSSNLAPISQQERAIAEIHRIGGKHQQRMITDLTLSGPAISDEDLINLSRFTNLYELDLSDSKITNQGLRHVGSLASLQVLDLSYTKITDSGLDNLRGLAELKELDLALPQLTDAGLVHIKELTGLHELDLYGSLISDAGLDHIKKLTNLQRLFLQSTNVTDRGLETLRGLINLRSLGLSNTLVSDKGLQYLDKLSHLRELDLAGTKISDAGLENIKILDNLQKLDLSNTAISSLGLKYVQGETQLHELDLSGTRIGDEGLEHLNSLRDLYKLDLSNTNITDVGLAKLKDLPILRRLSLRGTKVTEEGAKQLQGVLPKVKIFR